MKKRLLLTTLVATMTLSTLLAGCGSKEESNDSNTTTPATKVEEGETKDTDNSTSVDSDAKEEEDETSYVEKYLEEPDWEAKYESKKTFWIGKGKTEEEAEEKAKSAIEQEKFEYNGKKFVFEDMTKKFKNKESIVLTEDIKIYGMTKEDGDESVICDVINTIPKDTETLIYDRKAYTQFIGFNVDKVEVYNVNLEKKSMMVTLYANNMMINDFYTCPMFLKAIIGCNDDGTFFYKTIEFVYDIDPTKVNN